MFQPSKVVQDFSILSEMWFWNSGWGQSPPRRLALDSESFRQYEQDLDPFSAFPAISTQKKDFLNTATYCAYFFQTFKNPLVSCGSWICRSPPLWIAPSSSARPWTATTRGTRPWSSPLRLRPARSFGGWWMCRDLATEWIQAMSNYPFSQR